MLNKTITTLLLPRPGKCVTLDDGTVVADSREFDIDSTLVLASGVWPALTEHHYRASFMLPVEHFDYTGLGHGKPNSAVVKGIDLIAVVDEGLKGKARIDFMKPLSADRGLGKGIEMLAQLTFTRKSSAAYFKLMLGGR